MTIKDWIWPSVIGILFVVACFIPAMWKAYKEYMLLRDSNNLQRMRARRSKIEAKEYKKELKLKVKQNKRMIVWACKKITESGKLKTKDEFLVQWFTEQGYEVEKDSPYNDYYNISVPKVTDKELSDIMLEK